MTRETSSPPLITPKNLALMTALGFSSGLPLALSGFTLRMWLTSDHLALGIIGLTANIGLAYTLKFLWAPVFDELAAPLLWRLGRRRGWLLLVQAALVACIAGLALSDPGVSVALTLAIGALLAFVSASQDILIDAWRIESFVPKAQGIALAGYVWGYRAAMLISGAGVIALSVQTGWHVAILLTAGLALVGPLATWLAAEPAPPAQVNPHGFGARFKEAVVAPLQEFLSRRGALVLIAFIISFRLGEALAGVMLAPYYTSLGFNRAVIAVANGPISLVATLLGTALGGWLVTRIGVGKALLLTTLFQTLALLMYPALGLFPGQPHMLVVTSVLESFAEGFQDATFLTYMSGLCNRQFTATQYALLSSLAPLALRTIGGLSGFMAQAMGFIPFFIMTSFAALPALLLLLVILRFFPPEDTRLAA
ncbi:MAG: MFS transporter [Acidocella sp. 20-57-95]|nr:MAG: MFS transporter [Acidocella sp. 20-57-95]OYV62385.1 MAG: MFS transporter [Acidocella sp. 21-58-7]HQT63099.1 MFS transporter [Acidocella sp.]HQU03818.1 MFS transporter [Acidocella sp.]